MNFNLNRSRAYHISYLLVAIFLLYGLFLDFSQKALLQEITSSNLAGRFFTQKQQEEISDLRGRADSIAATIAKLTSIQLENIQSYGLQKEGLAATLEPFMDYREVAGVEVTGMDGRACAAMWKSGGKNVFRTDYSLPASFRRAHPVVVVKTAVTSAGVQGTISLYVDDRSISQASARISRELQRSARDEAGKLIRHFRDTLLPQALVLACAASFIMLSCRVIGRSYSLIETQRRELEVFNRQLEQRVAERTGELSTALALIDATLQATTDGVAALDGEGNLTSFNDNFIRMWRLRREDAHDRACVLEAILDQLTDRSRAESRVHYLQANPDAESMEVLELKDGRIFEEYSKPQRVGDRAVGRVWSYRDVTLRMRAERELRKAQSELLSASRKAGMAEIATSLLHSVGNVLNSVNISANLVTARIRGSKASAVSKVADLLQNHASDIGGFITQDDKGKLLPGYLESLSRTLAAEQSEVVDELAKLTASIEHIKEIIATQQSYAGSRSIIEQVTIRELVEDALRMKAEEVALQQVEVVQEIDETPALPLDRTRVLQILVNLIGNASQAMANTEGSRQITLQARQSATVLHISVTDNGEGIAAGNLTRIFNHGFTTRKDGHGFGLHSCALAAKEMGGSLRAESGGPGEGATFTLELPVKA